MVNGKYIDSGEQSFLRYSCIEDDRKVTFELTLRFEDLSGHEITGTRVSAELRGWRPAVTDALAAAEYRMLWQHRLNRLAERVQEAASTGTPSAAA